MKGYENRVVDWVEYVIVLSLWLNTIINITSTLCISSILGLKNAWKTWLLTDEKIQAQIEIIQT